MFRKIAVGSAACVLTLASLGLAAPAFAAEPASSTLTIAHATQPTPPPRLNKQSTLAEIQAAGATATSNRITSLNTGITKVTATSTLSAADRSTILATLNADLAAMNTLKAKIAADTDIPTATADYHSIFTGYRVYAVALQQSYIAAAADGLTNTAIPKLQSAATKISAYFAANPSKATPALQAQLTDMQAKTADAVSKTNGLASTALAVTPSAYNSNHAILAQPRTDAHTALSDTKAAAADGKAILAALK